MTTLSRALSRPPSPPLSRHAPFDPVRWSPTAGAARAWTSAWPVPLLALVFAAWLVGAGYVGTGSDDWWYLEAARCWAAHGGCVARTHWATRLPLVVPMAGALSLFGEGWRAAAVVPFAYSAGCVVLLARLVARWRGPTAGRVAGLVLVATPVFPLAALQPSVDAAELFWLLLAATGLARAHGHERVGPAVWAGVALGLACVTRLTAVAVVPFLAVALWPATAARLRRLVGVGAGAAAVLGAEAAGYGWATGSPVHHLRLALGHTRVPSSALDPSVPLDQSPILNPLYIDGWARRAGVHVHWSVDGLLNLLASPAVGATLLTSAVLLVLAWRAGAWSDRPRPAGSGPAGAWPEGRTLAALTGCAVAHAVVLILVLAVDPGPRMVLVEVAVAAATIGALGPPLWAAGRRPVLLALMLVAGVKLALELPNVLRVPLYAERVAAFAPPGPGVALDEATARAFTLEGRWRGVATRPAPSADTDLVAMAPGSCEAARPAGARLRAWRRVDRPGDGGALIAALARTGALAGGTPILACRFTPG